MSEEKKIKNKPVEITRDHDFSTLSPDKDMEPDFPGLQLLMKEVR
jgi:hypothetical protein